jgi:hypothetical protein
MAALDSRIPGIGTTPLVSCLDDPLDPESGNPCTEDRDQLTLTIRVILQKTTMGCGVMS